MVVMQLVCARCGVAVDGERTKEEDGVENDNRRETAIRLWRWGELGDGAPSMYFLSVYGLIEDKEFDGDGEVFYGRFSMVFF